MQVFRWLSICLKIAGRPKTYKEDALFDCLLCPATGTVIAIICTPDLYDFVPASQL